MTLLCLVTSLFQLVLLVTLTGILVSVAAVSRLMEVAINLIHPTTVFLLHQSGKLIVYILRPEHAPYLNTAGTVLLGWLIVSWMSYIMWTLLAPLSITAIAVILVCPKTIEWMYKQTTPSFENTLRGFMEKFRVTVPQTYSK